MVQVEYNPSKFSLLDIESLPEGNEKIRWSGGRDSKGEYHKGAENLGWVESIKQLQEEHDRFRQMDTKGGLIGVDYAYMSHFPEPDFSGQSAERRTGYMLVSTNRTELVTQARRTRWK